MESGDHVLIFSEFLVFLGIWFLMTSIISPSPKEWFLSLPINQFDGTPYEMNGYMEGQQFEQNLRVCNSLRNRSSILLTDFGRFVS